MSERKRTIIKPNPWVLWVVIGAAVVGVILYVSKMYHLEQTIQEMVQTQIQKSASSSAEPATYGIPAPELGVD